MTDENLRRSIRAIGIFQYFISFMLLAGGSVPYIFFFLQPELRSELHRAVIVGGFVIAFAIFYFLLARNLRQFRPWARKGTMVISCIGLLGVPIGTIINAAFLYVLIKGKHLFCSQPDTSGEPPSIPIDQGA